MALAQEHVQPAAAPNARARVAATTRATTTAAAAAAPPPPPPPPPADDERTVAARVQAALDNKLAMKPTDGSYDELAISFKHTKSGWVICLDGRAITVTANAAATAKPGEAPKVLPPTITQRQLQSVQVSFSDADANLADSAWVSGKSFKLDTLYFQPGKLADVLALKNRSEMAGFLGIQDSPEPWDFFSRLAALVTSESEKKKAVGIIISDLERAIREKEAYILSDAVIASTDRVVDSTAFERKAKSVNTALKDWSALQDLLFHLRYLAANNKAAATPAATGGDSNKATEPTRDKTEAEKIIENTGFTGEKAYVAIREHLAASHNRTTFEYKLLNALHNTVDTHSVFYKEAGLKIAMHALQHAFVKDSKEDKAAQALANKVKELAASSDADKLAKIQTLLKGEDESEAIAAKDTSLAVTFKEAVKTIEDAGKGTLLRYLLEAAIALFTLGIAHAVHKHNTGRWAFFEDKRARLDGVMNAASTVFAPPTVSA